MSAAKWVDEARPFGGEVNYFQPSDEFLCWLELEQAASYKALAESMDGKQCEVVMVENPHARRFKVLDGQVTFYPGPPVPTGTFVPAKLRTLPSANFGSYR